MSEHISSGSPWEDKVGYSRAVIAGNTIFISGTSGDGVTVYDQTRSALTAIDEVLKANGFSMQDVVSSRLSVADFDHWEDAAQAHREAYGAVKPAFTLVHALPFVDASILVEAEAIAVRA